jgi:hypothetical protein
MERRQPFPYSLLAIRQNMPFSLAARCARVLQIRSPPKERGRRRPSKRGRREDRVRAAPAVSRAKVVNKTHTSIQVQRKQSGLPCAMVLRLIPCSPRRDLACLSPSFPRSLLPRNLTPAIGASGQHDFAVRISRARQSQPSRPPLPAPTSVTMANAPLSGRDGEQYAADLGLESRRISENQKDRGGVKGWTGQLSE